MKYKVYFTQNGAKFEADTIETNYIYTAEQYIKDCQRNEDESWRDMLDKGFITVEKVED